MKNFPKKVFRFSLNLLILVIVFSLFSGCIFPELGETGLLDRLHKCKYVTADFNADIQSNNEFVSFSILTADNVPIEGTEDWPLEWNDNQFNCTYDYSYEMFSGEHVRTYGEVTGTLTDDAEQLESLTINQTSLHLDSGDVFKDFITVLNIPYDSDYEYDSYSPRFSVEGAQVIDHVYSYSQSWEFQDSDGNTQTIYATEVYYDNPDDVPYLLITFSED